MENRELVLADYFKLKILLNRTNLIRDQKTEVVLLALQTGPLKYSLIATLKGIQNPKYIELCKMSGRGYWQPAEHSGLFDLEEFCSSYLEENLRPNFSLDDITKWVWRLKKEFQSLGIP